MKKLFTFVTFAILLSACVYVQAQDRQMMRINVPFSFTAENTSLPAGAYNVYLATPFNLVKVQSVDGRGFVALQATSKQIASYQDNGALVFHRIAGQYFLIGAREVGSNLQREFRLGSYGQELARKREFPQAEKVLNAGR